MFAESQLLHALLDRAAAQWPDATAVTDGETRLTYRQLDAASRAVADWLRRHGVIRARRILIVGVPATLIPSIVYATSRVGAVFTILHEQVRGSQLEHLLEDFAPHLVISGAVEVRDVASALGVAVASPESIASEADNDVSATVPSHTPLAVDPVCMIYTSGTTSRPKAVVSTHAQMMFAVEAIQSVICYRPDDVVYNFLPLSFDYGLYQLFIATAAGAQLRLGQYDDLGRNLLERLVDSSATVLPVVPSLAEILIRALDRSGRQLPSLRLVTNTGAALSARSLEGLRKFIPDVRIHVMFGLTECKRATIMPADGDLERPDSCGRALPGTEVFVVGSDGQRLTAGEVGEIVVRGPNVMAGYWRSPDLSAMRFPRIDGLFPELRTGDYGWVDDEGYLYFSGRHDDIYKVGGFRVSTVEVEAAARGIDGVTGAAVVPPSADSPAVLFVVGDVTPKRVRESMRVHLEDFKIPKYCRVVRALPLTANGKVDRSALASAVTPGADVTLRVHRSD